MLNPDNEVNSDFYKRESRLKRMDKTNLQYDKYLKWTLLEIDRSKYNTLEEFLDNHTVLKLKSEDFNILERNNRDYIICTSIISTLELEHLRNLDYLKIIQKDWGLKQWTMKNFKN